jgi:anthranilate synthase/aminodeoxychorismate synthase-like glutamine amidotransferase
MSIVILDSRDSFTFNLAHAFEELGGDVAVIDVDSTDAAAVMAMTPSLVVVGPGPRGPAELPHLVQIVLQLDGVVPLLGVCLGLQALVVARGGVVVRAEEPVHGKRSLITHDGSGVFASLPSPLWVMRYHSLIAESRTLPSSLRVCAQDDRGQIMAVTDDKQTSAVQFHPESIGTAGGLALLANAIGVECSRIRHRPGYIPQAHDRGPGFNNVDKERP